MSKKKSRLTNRTVLFITEDCGRHSQIVLCDVKGSEGGVGRGERRDMVRFKVKLRLFSERMKQMSEKMTKMLFLMQLGGIILNTLTLVYVHDTK